jgi:hypothetical protein
MATLTRIESNTFGKGLFSDASPTSSSDGISLVDENMEFQKDGSRRRRLGLDYFNPAGVNANNRQLTGTSYSVDMHVWHSPDQNNTTSATSFNIIVVRVGSSLLFYRDDSNWLEAGFLGAYPLPYNTALGPLANFDGELAFASLRGKFYASAGSEIITEFTYNPDTNTVDQRQARLLVRDNFGIQSDRALGARHWFPVGHVLDNPTYGWIAPIPAAGSQQIYHDYNLRNQGWPFHSSRATNIQGNGREFGDPVWIRASEPLSPDSWYMVAEGDSYHRNKSENAKKVDVIGIYNPFLLTGEPADNGKNPQGRYILDLFKRGESRYDQWEKGFRAAFLDTDPQRDGAFPLDQDTGRIMAMAGFAGRVFYAVKSVAHQEKDGRSPRLNDMILFSQNSTEEDSYFKCYQDSDPTSESEYQVVDTDGGFVVIPNLGDVKKMVVLGAGLLVLSSNGVWEISGGEEAFSATNAKVRKVSNASVYGAGSVVETSTSIAAWTDEGIIAFTFDDMGSKATSANLTVGILNTYYHSIHDKQRVRGYFDPQDRSVRWLHSPLTFPNRAPQYRRELVFDTDLGAFRENTFGVHPLEGVGVTAAVHTRRRIYLSSKVTINSELARILNFGFSDYTSKSFKDFGITEAHGIIETAYITGSASAANKQLKMVTVNMRRTPYEGEGGYDEGFNPDGAPSSCLFYTKWGYTLAEEEGRWSRPFEMFRPPTIFGERIKNYEVVSTKSTVTGRGTAFVMRFETSPAKDLWLLGWAATVKVLDFK